MTDLRLHGFHAAISQIHRMIREDSFRFEEAKEEMDTKVKALGHPQDLGPDKGILHRETAPKAPIGEARLGS